MLGYDTIHEEARTRQPHARRPRRISLLGPACPFVIVYSNICLHTTDRKTGFWHTIYGLKGDSQTHVTVM